MQILNNYIRKRDKRERERDSFLICLYYITRFDIYIRYFRETYAHSCLFTNDELIQLFPLSLVERANDVGCNAFP